MVKILTITMIQNQEKKTLAELPALLDKKKFKIVSSALPDSAKALLLADLLKKEKKGVVYISSSQKEAEDLIERLSFFSSPDKADIEIFPSYHVMPYQAVAYNTETLANRIRLLYRFISGNFPSLTIICADTLVQRLIPLQDMLAFSRIIELGEELKREELFSFLINSGYQRVTLVEEAGEFAVRGGIVDIFSPAHSEALRLEFFGDTVESIRFFSASSQRKLEDTDSFTILPAREMLLQPSSMEFFLGRLRQSASEAGFSLAQTREIIDKIRDLGLHSALDGQLSLLYPEPALILDYLNKEALIFVDNPTACEAVIEKQKKALERCREEALASGRIAVPYKDLYLEWDEILGAFSKSRLFIFKEFQSIDDEEVFSFDVEENLSIRAELGGRQMGMQPLLPLVKWIDESLKKGCKTLLVSNTPSQSERIEKLLEAYGVSGRKASSFKEIQEARLPSLFFCEGRIKTGFVWQDEALSIISEEEIFGAKKRRTPSRKFSAKERFLNLGELREGDIVVHAEHGLGRFEGIEQMRLNGVLSDFIFISYRDGDRLYLPVDRMSVLHKYLGVDGVEPVLDKMGAKNWAKAREKAKAEVEKLAGELLSLYAARKVHLREPFSPADAAFSDFEAGFPYEETQDQLRVISEVLKDMDGPNPMDRLVCGDVGYGKTEVALRAAFRSVMDGRQVAILVPTTVLAEQHYRSFTQRFEKYPVNIAALDRLRSSAQQTKIVAGLKDGSIDIAIGTHRLLQKDVGFKNLGLLIIDEEQRFGVRHKEVLKKMRESVDALALTATPIPRTLHMSLMGMRDISVIASPPEERRPIISYISSYDENLIRESITREVERGGQVFFVHNNINSIEGQINSLQKLFPDLRIGMAHGRMKEEELENQMLAFVRKESEILVCTTIIESGLDIPSANTMIINRADRFGLSQLYQLRGRIGRGDVQAYAYLFIPDEAKLTRDAGRRLKVLMEHSDLGSGFQIAMSDLQIRGGGAALGANQSGHIAALGYDMFLKLMEEAVSELKGEPVLDPLEPEINLYIDAFIPESYIPDLDQRIAIYRRLSRISLLSEIKFFKEELLDRYGALPAEANNMLLKIMLKIFSIKAGVRSLDLRERQLVLVFSELHQKKPMALSMDLDLFSQESSFLSDGSLKFELLKDKKQSPLLQARNILKEIASHVNG